MDNKPCIRLEMVNAEVQSLKRRVSLLEADCRSHMLKIADLECGRKMRAEIFTWLSRYGINIAIIIMALGVMIREADKFLR